MYAVRKVHQQPSSRKQESHMENKPATKYSDTFLTRFERTNPHTLFSQWRQTTGKIRSFDKYPCSWRTTARTIDFQTRDSTVVSNRSVIHSEHRPALCRRYRSAAVPAPLAPQATANNEAPSVPSGRLAWQRDVQQRRAADAVTRLSAPYWWSGPWSARLRTAQPSWRRVRRACVLIPTSALRNPPFLDNPRARYVRQPPRAMLRSRC